MEISNSLIIFDLETTGVWIQKDKIIEIAMIKITPEGDEEIYHKLINPGISIPKIVSELTGISDEDVKGKPYFREVALEIQDFIGNCDFAGFNIERFDLPILEREMFEAGLKLEWRQRNYYDAQKVFHLNEKRDLAAAYNFYCKKDLSNAHSAAADAKATFEILKEQVKKYGKGENHIEALQVFEYQRTEPFYDAEGKFCWWNGELYPTFGKYARRVSLRDLVQKDKPYLKWILKSEFNEEVKEIVEGALLGRFPSPAKN